MARFVNDQQTTDKEVKRLFFCRSTASAWQSVFGRLFML